MISTRANLGPLTESWSWPAHCATPAVPSNGITQGWLAQQCVETAPKDDPSCRPPRTADASISTVQPLGGWGFYSPGVICPGGFTTACSSASGDGGNACAMQFALQAAETGVVCCPSGYDHHTVGTYIQSCTSTLSAGSAVVATCSQSKSEFSLVSMPAYKTETESSSITSSVVSEFLVRAPMVQIVWRSSDLQTSSTAGTTTGSVASSNTTSSPTSTASSSSSSSGLSAGAYAGIGIAATMAALGLLSLLGFWIWRHRKRRLAGPEDANAAGYAGLSQGSPPSHGADSAWKTPASPPVYEMDRGPNAHEMDGAPTGVYEMGETNHIPQLEDTSPSARR